MDMEVTAWNQLYGAMNARQERRPFSAATLRRIAAFARPHKARLARFLALSLVMAALAVAAPVLAGRVVDAIVKAQPFDVVLGLAGLIAGLALAEAGLGLLTRYLSASIGEGLILDLRTAVFDHVQRMPIAFFTRTRTGALVSRLNNDVIGAQRAFTDIVSSVAGNVVTLVLTLIVMIGISWQITLLALLLLPVFVLPARRMGGRIAKLRREGRRPQRRHGHPDDRALLRARSDAGQAVRPPRARVLRVRRQGPQGPRHRRAHRRDAGGIRHRADPGLRPGPGPGVRPRRLLRPAR
ncbi:ABC-type multidrug transport system fused ATPase/permease subunit [Nonomuraea dietziae]|uniref:ABC-type multidrug transport system fused ATPase/permease subunit n=1 Tax=Nonomuraea dietziae TaxID=65515 RepID=A0A7W5YQX4_9ACTN|nr:ABC-type multidrug transport system fused ATPase/permease subunit [Nonomuraea dietziae]